jgi:hypothetical protein
MIWLILLLMIPTDQGPWVQHVNQHEIEVWFTTEQNLSHAVVEITIECSSGEIKTVPLEYIGRFPEPPNPGWPNSEKWKTTLYICSSNYFDIIKGHVNNLPIKFLPERVYVTWLPIIGRKIK